MALLELDGSSELDPVLRGRSSDQKLLDFLLPLSEISLMHRVNRHVAGAFHCICNIDMLLVLSIAESQFVLANCIYIVLVP